VTATGALAWSFTGDSNDWSWIWNTEFGRSTQILDGTPTQLIPFFDHEGSPTLYVVADNGTAWMFDQTGFTLEPTTIQFAAHPDFGRTATVWRPGEDLLIAVGLGLIKYTVAGVKDPEMGLSRGDGMPYTNLGAIVDLEPETSMLFALVSGTTETSSTFAYDSQWGTVGSGDGELNAPRQLARDGNGDIYVADSANSRVQRFSSAGAYEAQATGLSGITGVAVDSTPNTYVSFSTDAVRKLDNTLATTWTVNIGGTSGTVRHLATDGTHLYVCSQADDVIYKRLCSTGAAVATLGSSGTGNGQFANPHGIAYSSVTGTLYVVDQGNDRVQEISTTGTYIRQWGTTGTGDGQFTTPVAVAVNPQNGAVYVTDSGRDDIQVFTATGAYISTFGATGTGNGQFTSPEGVVLSADGLSAWVSDDSSNERVQKFTTTTTVASVNAKPTVMYWTGTGWHGAWEGSDDNTQLTWANVTTTSHTTDGYRLWWGSDDGNVYTMPLRRTFHNPRSGWQAGVDRFAESGYILTSRFDALMTGFYKKASRLVLFVDNATPTERIRVRYRVDYANSDDTENGWTDFSTDGSATYITEPGRHILEFGLDASGFSWGERFNYIQFRIDLDRGDDEYQTPVLHAMVLNYTKIPQQAKTFQMTVPFPKEEWMGRTGKTIREDLEELLRADQYVKLVHQEQTYRGQLSAVAGLTATGLDYEGGATVSFIEIPTDN
jgi:DNA-binding beta-propeller fold protein YncE